MMPLTLLFPNEPTDQHEKEEVERETVLDLPAMAKFVFKLKTLHSSYLIVFPVNCFATCLWLSYIPFKPDFFTQRH